MSGNLKSDSSVWFRRVLISLLASFSSFSVANADFDSNETGVIAEAVVPEFASGGVTDPQSATFDGNSLFGTPPPGVQGFTGSAIISSDSPLPAVANEVGMELKVETSVVGSGFDLFIANRSQAQVTFQVQTVAGSSSVVPLAFQLNSTAILTAPTGDTSGTAFSGNGFTFDFKQISPAPADITSLNSFTTMGTSGSVVVSEGSNVVAVVNEAGSTSDEHRKSVGYSQFINADVIVGQTYSVNASTSCFSSVESGFVPSGAAAYSCFAGDTFEIDLSSSDPNVRFNVINVVAVPEPSAFLYLGLVGLFAGYRRWRR